MHPSAAFGSLRYFFCSATIALSLFVFTSLHAQKSYYPNGKLKQHDSTLANGDVLHTEYYSFGILFKKGILRNGLREGLWQQWDYDFDPATVKAEDDPDFIYHREFYTRDTLDGPYYSAVFDFSQKKPLKWRIWTGAYRNGQKEGEWRRYGMSKGDSFVNLYQHWRKGEQVSQTEWLRDMKEWRYNELHDGQPHGHTIEYWPNGKKRCEGRMESVPVALQPARAYSYRTGGWTFYDREGNVLKNILYVPISTTEGNSLLRLDSGGTTNTHGSAWSIQLTTEKLTVPLDSYTQHHVANVIVKGVPQQAVSFKAGGNPFPEKVKSLYYTLCEGKPHGNIFLQTADRQLHFSFRDGQADGRWWISDPGGALLCEGQFADNQPEGLFTAYENAQKQFEYYYLHGLLQWWKSYTPEGILLEEKAY